MKANEKKMIAVLIAITLIVIVIFLVTRARNNNDSNSNSTENIAPEEEFVDVLSDGTKLNTSETLQKTKTFDGMEISKFQLTEKDNVTLLLGTITNTSEETKGGYPVDITVVDKNGNTIVVVQAYIKSLEPGASTQLSTSATFDYANAYDFTISKK